MYRQIHTHLCIRHGVQTITYIKGCHVISSICPVIHSSIRPVIHSFLSWSAYSDGADGAEKEWNIDAAQRRIIYINVVNLFIFNF